MLVVDQFDAVSTASGRTVGAFDLVERLLQNVRSLPAVPPVHTVIVCREFDLANDSGLRSIIAQSARAVTVEEFSTAELESILGEAGWNSDDLHRRQRDLLRVPQNLALFLDIVGDDSAHAEFLDRERTLRSILEGEASVPSSFVLACDEGSGWPSWRHSAMR